MRPASELRAFVASSVEASLAAKQKLREGEELIGQIAQVGQLMAEALRDGHKILLFGNGGSAADAQHIAAELVGRYKRERLPLAALALTTNTSSITAIGNDYDFAMIFARQVLAFGRKGDVAIGISTSGNSGNVIKAVEAARSKGLHTVALTGSTGGKLKPLVDHCLCVPSSDTPRIQECHILIGHIVSDIVEGALFGD